MCHARINEGSCPPPESLPCLNSSNFSAIMSNSCITESGTIASANTFHDFLGGVPGLRISSSLTHRQWLVLLHQIQKHQEALLTSQGHAPAFNLWVDEPDQQPKAFNIPPCSGSEDTVRRQVSRVAVMVSEDRFLNNDTTAQPLVFDITPETQLARLAYTMSMVSREHRQFKIEDSHFLAALKAGKPILLRGIESNPELLAELETLLAPEPFLWLHGRRIPLPQARVEVLWTGKKTVSSPVWRPLISEEQAQDTHNRMQEVWTRNQESSQCTKASFMEMLEKLQTFDQAIQDLPKNLKNIPGACALSVATMNKIALQAILECRLDAAEELTPYHWRKAINSVYIKEYRCNPDVYSWLKCLTAKLFSEPGDNGDRCDVKDIHRLLQDFPNLDRKTLRKHFWQFARLFDSRLFPDIPASYSEPSAAVVDQLARELVAQSPPERQRWVHAGLFPGEAYSANVQSQFVAYDSYIEKVLSDALPSLHIMGTGITRHALLRELANQCSAICQETNLNSEQKLSRLGSLLIETVNFSRKASVQLAKEIASGHYNRDRWLKRELARLRAKVNEHSVVFLKGDTGAGKSWTAREVARQLNPVHLEIVTVGPTTTDKDLFGRSVLKNIPGSAPADSETCMIPGPVLRWATSTPGGNNEPCILIIDEATLQAPGALDWLNGLFAPEPFITWQGRRIKLTDRHKVILTSNPEHFSGRNLHPAIREQAVTSYYRPLPSDFLAQCIIEPELAKLPVLINNPEQRQAVTQLIQTLWRQYQTLLPHREYTPRDILTVIQRTRLYLEQSETVDSCSQLQLNGVIRQSFKDIIGGELLREQEPEQESLDSWLDCHWPVDRLLLDRCHDKFEQFYLAFQLEQGREAKVDYNFSNPATKSLAQALWWQFLGASSELHDKTPHKGRHATLIEGPPGRGKDTLLDRLAVFFSRQHHQSTPVHLTAGPHNWDKVKQAVIRAKNEGRVVIISELNLLKSHYLEGILNDLLDGEATPGFQLFATVNPVTFGGRRNLSPALKNRMTCHRLNEYSRDELTAIIHTLWPEAKSIGEKLLNWHCELTHRLRAKRHLAIPSASNLVELLIFCRDNNKDEDEIENVFSEHYHIYISALHCSISDLNKCSESPPPLTTDPAISHWLYRSLPWLNKTMTIVNGKSTLYPDAFGRLQLDETLSEGEKRSAAVKALAEHHWKAFGLPVHPPNPENGLLSAVYRHWQQQWAREKFADTGVSGNELFPMTLSEEATLHLPYNRRWVGQCLHYINDSQQPGRLLYSRIQGLITASPSPDTPAQEYKFPETPAPECKLPKTDKAIFVDGNTKQKNHTDKLLRIFRNSLPDFSRVAIFSLHCDPNVCCEREQNYGQAGLEVILPSPLRLPVKLTGTQDYGMFKLSPPFGNWQCLPSATPHERIVAIGSQPEVEMEHRRDPATGQHLIRITPHHKKPKPVILHYVTEPLHIGSEFSSTPPVMSCPEILKVELDKMFTANPRLRLMFEADSPKERVQKIIRYCNQFSADDQLGGKTSDVHMMINIIARRKGVCRHQSWCFYSLAAYFGISVRLVDSGTFGLHEWCEYSLDGRLWQRADLNFSSSATIKTTIKEVSQRLPSDYSIPGLDELVKKIPKEELSSMTPFLMELMEKGVEYFLKSGMSQKDIFLKLAWQNTHQSYCLEIMMGLLESDQELSRNILLTEPYRFFMDLYLHSENMRDALEKQLNELGQRVDTMDQLEAYQWKALLKQLINPFHSMSHFRYQESKLIRDRLYRFIVNEHQWLTPVETYKHILEKHAENPTPLLKQQLTTYTRQLVSTTPEHIVDKELPDVPDVHGHSESLRRQLFDQDLERRYSYEAEGTLDINQLVRRQPMFFFDAVTNRGKKNVLINNDSELFHKVRSEAAKKCCHHLLSLKTLPVQVSNDPAWKLLYETLQALNRFEELAHTENNPKLADLVAKLRKTAREAVCTADANNFYWHSYVSELKALLPEAEDKISVLFNNRTHRLLMSMPYILGSVLKSAFVRYLYEITGASDGKLQVCVAAEG